MIVTSIIMYILCTDSQLHLSNHSSISLFYDTYLRRQQERGLMQKARRLMDENSVVLNSSVFCYTWFRKPNLHVQTRSGQYLEACFILLLLFFLYEGSMRRSQNLEKVKKNFIRHFARFNFSRLSLAFILKYYPILHAVKR